MTNIKLNDSEKITAILHHFNLKKSEFSAKTGISTQQIFDLIRGQIANLSRENMAKILASFPDISPHWLITGEGSMLAATIEQGNVTITNGGNNYNHSSANLDALIEMLASQQRTIERLANLIK